MTQDPATRTVTITYSLDADAVVTLDIQTNATSGAWASIGGANIQCVSGAVFRRVTAADADAQGRYTITWHPDLSWPDHKITGNGARAAVTAWALDNTPDYMVVDVSAAAQPGDVRYYPGVDWLPGGILGNMDYRENKIVMRKIMAKGVEWTMGSVNEAGREAAKEATHTVQLTNNYYIGVFEVTRTQWVQVYGGADPSYFTDVSMRAHRPVEYVSYNQIRRGKDKDTVSNGEWPDEPAGDSFLGKLQKKTEIDFDLPSEAQWEFACRAGNGDGKWGNGAAYTGSTDPNCPGRNRVNLADPNVTAPGAAATTNQATNVCGSYAPNAWGIYDMHGNVWEWCLDFYAADVSSLRGAVNLTVGDLTQRVRHGGAWVNYPSYARSASRYSSKPDATDNALGFRLACRAGLK